MRIRRTIPPAAAPIHLKNLLHGLAGLFSGKAYLRKFETELKEYFGVKHVYVTSSGKAALTVTLRALASLSPGKSHVLIPAYTCFSVPSAIVKAGLNPSLCDINSATLDFDGELLRDALDRETLCVIATHLFGVPSAVEKIRDICLDRNIFVVEDAAQAMGGSHRGRYLGTIGDVGFFSLGRGKNITCGSGGIIVTNSDRIAAALEKEYSSLQFPNIIETVSELLKVLIMSIFIRPSLYWLPSGLPFLKLGETVFHEDFPLRKLSGMQAGLLRGWQRNLEVSNRKRRENAAYFIEHVLLPGKKRASVPYLRLPFLLEEQEMRESICSRLQKEGMGISRMYPSSINEIERLKDQFRGKEFLSATLVAERLLTVPTHHLLRKKDREKICLLLQETLSILPPAVSNPESPDSMQNQLKNRKLSLIQ